MASISISPTAIVFDGEDITRMVAAYRLEAVQGDVPMVVLELKPGVVGSTAIFDGVANVRVATEGIDIHEFLASVDPEQVEKAMLDDMSETAGTAALRYLRDLAQKLSP